MVGRVFRLAEGVLAVPRPHSVSTLRRLLKTETLRTLHLTSVQSKERSPSRIPRRLASVPVDSTFNILHPHFGGGLSPSPGARVRHFAGQRRLSIGTTSPKVLPGGSDPSWSAINSTAKWHRGVTSACAPELSSSSWVAKTRFAGKRSIAS